MPFRNLRAIRGNVAQELEHGPSTIDVREARVDLINRHYLEIDVSNEWLNLQTEADFPVYYNRTAANTNATVAVVAASTLIAFSGSLGTAFAGAAGGMTFLGPDSVTYTIVRFTSGTGAFITPAYAGATDLAATDWEIRAERFYLPADCTKALRFLNPEQLYGPMQIIDRRTRENMTAFIQNAAGTVFWMADDDMIYDRPPDPGWTAIGSNAAGTLTSTGTYEVCYTFDMEGRESPPSTPVRVTMSATNTSINVAGMENTVLNSGIYKNVYIRQLTSGPTLPAQEVYGRWLLVSTVTVETQTTQAITAMPAPIAQVLYFTNGRKYMRAEWTPGEDVTLRLRYLYCPPRLVADSDVPKWPEAVQDILVWGPAADLGLSQSSSSAKIDRWQDRYEKLVKKFMGLQINVPDAPARRRMRNYTGGCGPNGYMIAGGSVTGDFNG